MRRGNRLDGQVNVPAVTARLPSVGYQVGQDLLYLVSVRTDGWTGGGQLSIQDHVFGHGGSEQRETATADLGKIQPLMLGVRLSQVGQHEFAHLRRVAGRVQGVAQS